MSTRTADRLVCPVCLAFFTAETVQWRDEHGAPAAPLPRRPEGLRRWLPSATDARTPPSPGQVADALARGLHAVCPQGHPLPQEFLSRRTLVIGMVGERGSSKSHYLASLGALLSEGRLSRYRMSAQLAGASAQRFHELYYAPLYQQRHAVALEGTMPVVDGEAREPVTFVLRNLITNEACNLLFYDAAGEQLMTASAQARFNRFLCVADVVMLFITPATLPGVWPRLTDAAPAQSVLVTGSMFEEVADHLRQARNLPDEADLSGVSVQVLLSKADQLLALPEFDRELLEEPDHSAFLLSEVLGGLEEDSRRVAKFIESSGAVNLVANIGHRFGDVTFHAVSATGHDAVDGVFPAIAPLRCLDPLLVALADTGVLRPREIDRDLVEGGRLEGGRP